MPCPFVEQFFTRLHIDAQRSSIDFDLLERLYILRGEGGGSHDTTDLRVGWACVAALETETTPAGRIAFAVTTEPRELSNKLLDIGLQVLAPIKRQLIIHVTEAEIVGERDGAIVQRRNDARYLKQVHRVEALLAAARVRDYDAAANAFYDYVYHYNRDLERTFAVAERLTEIA